MNNQIKEYEKYVKQITKEKQHYRNFEKQSQQIQEQLLNNLKGIELYQKKKLLQIQKEVKNFEHKINKLKVSCEQRQIIEGQIKQEQKLIKQNEKLESYIQYQETQISKKKMQQQKAQQVKSPPKFNQTYQHNYKLTPNLQQDALTQQLLKELDLLQQQYDQNEIQIQNFEKCIQQHHQKNQKGEDFSQIEKKETINSIENKNKNLQILIQQIQDQNQDLFNDIDKINQQCLERQKNIEIINGTIQNHHYGSDEDQQNQIQNYKKKIQALEEQILKVTDIKDVTYGNYSLEDIKNLDEQIQKQNSNILQIQTDTEFLKRNQTELQKKLEKLENDEQQLKDKLCKKQIFFDKQLYQYEEDNNNNVRNSQTSTMEYKEVLQQKNQRIFLSDLGEKLNKQQMKQLGLKRDEKNKGWYNIVYNENLQENQEQNIRQNLLKEETACIQLANQIDTIKRQIEINKNIPQQTENIEDDIQQNQHYINNMIEYIQDFKEVIQYKIQNNILKPNSWKSGKSIFNIQDQINDSKNYIKMILGKFKIFQKFLKINTINCQVVCHFQFMDYEQCYTKNVENLEGDFDSEFIFPIDFDNDFIKILENYNLNIYLQVRSQEQIENFRIQINFFEFYKKNKQYQSSPYLYQNKEIVYNEKEEHVGYTEFAMQFKDSPALNILLIETDLNDINAIKDIMQINKKDEKIKPEEIGVLTDQFFKPKDLYQDFFIIKAKKVVCKPLQIKVFLYLEINEQQYIFETVDLQDGSKQLKETQKILANISKLDDINFYLFDDSNEFEQNDQDFIGKTDIDVQQLLKKGISQVELNFNHKSHQINFLIELVHDCCQLIFQLLYLKAQNFYLYLIESL